jgi:hypothetical protein
MPHQGAQKCTKTGTEEASTSVSKLASLTERDMEILRGDRKIGLLKSLYRSKEAEKSCPTEFVGVW